MWFLLENIHIVSGTIIVVLAEGCDLLVRKMSLLLLETIIFQLKD
jgi:hypothetical protein